MSKTILSAKLPTSIKMETLRLEIENVVGEEWVEHVNKRGYEGGWEVLPLRCLAEHVNSHVILQGFSLEGEQAWENLPVLDKLPTIKHFLDGFGQALKSARLMKLKAGATIHPHSDAYIAKEMGEIRLHLAISGCDGVQFLVAEKEVPMRSGELWYINADQTHSVKNTGEQSRLNLVIDCIVDDTIDKMFAQATQVSKG
jgi:hypothetical protein